MHDRVSSRSIVRRGRLPRKTMRIAAVAACVLCLLQPAATEVVRHAVPAPPLVLAQRQQPIEPRQADFKGTDASAEVRHVAHWAVDSADNRGLPLLVVDKVNARLFVFGPAGKLLGTTPVLLGSARGDHSVPGIGEREIAQIRPQERTTPAGRFVAERGHNLTGEDIVWVDYDAAVSLHRVRPHVAEERRLERLASPTVADNRITYGCINVPVRFYDTVVKPVFASSNAVVYVLPETQPARKLFGTGDAAPKRAPRAAR